VLVTGAGGFIGGHLVERLVRDGARVRALVHYNSRNERGALDLLEPGVAAAVDVVLGELRDVESVAGACEGMEIVMHLGAHVAIPYSYRNPRDFFEVNILGTLNVAQAALRHGVARVVHTSTSEVYGTAQTVPIDETHVLHPQSPYAASKVAADQLALSFQRSFGTPVVVARPFNTFGPRQSARAVIPTIVTQALTRDVIELGATSPTRDFLFVDNTVQGLLRCAEVDGVDGEVINLGSGHEVSIGEVAERVLRLLGRELPIELDEQRVRPPASEVERLIADTAKAKRLLGWEPTVELEQGLQRTIEWLTGSLDAYKASLYNV
jgi:NAD dependent epimerase/dehydratase